MKQFIVNANLKVKEKMTIWFMAVVISIKDIMFYNVVIDMCLSS